jgi:hypothetical protein
MKGAANWRHHRSFEIFWLALLLFTMIACATVSLHAQNDSDSWVRSTRDENKASLVFISGKVTHKNGQVAEFAGTGFIVSPAGYLLTCNHVVPEYDRDVDKFEAHGTVGGRSDPQYSLSIVDSEKQGDLMLLTLPQEKTWPSVRSMAKWQLDSEVVALGFPKDTPLLAAPGRITSVDNNGRLITNSPLNHGMSGGPAFNRSGAIIGIAEGGYEEANSINLLIPITYATRLLQIADSPLLSDKPRPTPEPTDSPSPDPSSEQLRELWMVVIYRVGHSKFVDSYVPDEIHAAQLINALRDNEDVQKLIKNFEQQTKDSTLQKWFIAVDDTLDALGQDLSSLNRAVLQYPDIVTLDPWQKRALQTAEYNRVKLLGLLTQITLQLKLTDPLFANNSVRTVPPDTPTPLPSGTPAIAASPPTVPRTPLGDITYVLSTATDPVQPGKIAQFTITATNLTDSRSYSELVFHVPQFTTYGRHSEGIACNLVLGWLDAGASVSANLDLKVLGGNQSPPDGSIITLTLTDPRHGSTFSRSITINGAPVAILDLSTPQGTVGPGQAFDYFLTYHNASANSLAGAQLSVAVPVGASFVSTDAGGVLGSDQVVRWRPGDLAAGATGKVQLHMRAVNTRGEHPALLVEAALRDSANHLLTQASDFRAVYAAPTFSYMLTTTTDAVQPGKMAQFDIKVTNLTDSRAYSAFVFHVPRFTSYGRFLEGIACGVAPGWVGPGASVSVNLDLKVLGGNQSPPDGSILTLALTDLSRGASLSLCVGVNQRIAMLRQTPSSLVIFHPYSKMQTASVFSLLNHGSVQCQK